MTSEHLEGQALRFTLASKLTCYPDERLRPIVGDLRESGVCPTEADPLWNLVASDEGLDLARNEYLSLFDQGSERTPLYETEYGRMRGMSKGNELADIAGFYRAFGLAIADGTEGGEMVDHLSVELEFYAVLLVRQAHLLTTGDAEGGSIVEDARKKFLGDHLGRFAPAIAQRQNVQASALYSGVFAYARTLVEDECAALAVAPAPLDIHSLEAAPDSDDCCGALNQVPAPASNSPMPPTQN